MSMSRTFDYLVCFSVYSLIILIIGKSSFGESDSIGKFFIGERKCGFWRLFSTFVGTWVSAATILGYTGNVFENGTSVIAVTVIPWFIGAGLLYLISGRIYDCDMLTIPQFIGERYHSRFLRTCCALLLSGGYVFYLVIQIKGFGIAAATLLNIDYKVAIFLVYLFILYSTFGETVTALELAPEGTNYRAKTRFAKFYNLPELMQMFREVADIQTADMLKLPVPKVNYHNIKTKPSEMQTEMVASLAKRAEKVRARLVEPNIDNMLKITNDGRKLALDQRMIDPMLPDDPDSKVNACVDNVYRIWEEHADTKATQLVFCDLSTPKNDGTFNVYDDMREKLIARGIPAEQICFIHEATTDAQKKELFGKVRSGEVRVLFGSTPKMGAGTNVRATCCRTNSNVG